MNSASANATSNWRTSRCVDVIHVVVEKMNTTAVPTPATKETAPACLIESSCPTVWNTKKPTR